MMKKPMRFDRIMPADGVDADAEGFPLRQALGRGCTPRRSIPLPRSLRSSASSEACQKNIYGLIVVPNIATSISM